MKTPHTILCSLVAFAASTTIATAQQTYSLPQCIAQGLQQNYDLQIVRNSATAAANSATAAAAGYLPTVDLNAGYDADLNNIDTKARTTGVETSYNGVLDQATTVSASLNWTIFNGFSVRASYKRLQELKGRGQTDTRIAIEDYIASLASEYYNNIQQRNRLRNLRYATRLSKERLRIVEERYRIGSFSRLDYQQAKVDFNADSAGYIKQVQVLRASNIRLNELMASDDANRKIIIADTAIIINSRLDYDTLWRATLDTNAQLLRADQTTSIAELDYRRVKSRYYPHLRATAGYGYTFNRYGGNNTNTRRQSYGVNAGLVLGFNIFNGTRRSDSRNASLAVRNAALERQSLELRLRSELADIWHAYRNNMELLALERNNLVTAKENYEIAMERYMLGDLAGIDMREAQKSLLDAEDRIISAEYDTKLCEISLLLISGKILAYTE